MGIKNLTYRFLSFFLAVFFVTNLIAQDKPNVKFTYHTVSKGETSYGIAKKYQIDLNEFFNYNPSASNGLSKGDTLKIPIKTFVNQTIDNEIDSSIKIHKVLPGETLWSIAKIYGIRLPTIKAYNKLSTNELSESQLLLIPNIQSDTSNMVQPLFKHADHPMLKKCDTLIIHKVKKKETLYSISKKYSVGLDQIIKNNPILNEFGLKKDQELKIILRIKDCIEDSVENQNDSLDLFLGSIYDQKTLRISLILPFFTDKSDSIIANCPENTNCTIDKISENSFQIYNGVKIALRDLKELGYNLELNVFDSKYDTNTIKEIFQDTLFKSSNLIIGPLYSKNIKMMRVFSKNSHIPMISPYNIPSQALFNYPDLFKIQPSRSTQSKEMAIYIKNSKDDYNILLLSDVEDNKSKVYGNIFSDAFNDTCYLIKDSLKEVDSILPTLLKRGDDWSHLLDKLSKKKSNLIIITSNQVPFLTYAFNKIIEFSNSQEHYKSDFEIFGFEDIYRIKTIDVIYKNKFNLHFVSKGIPDLNSNRIADFKYKYRDFLSAEPTKYSYLGYDIVKSIFMKVYPDKLNSESYYQGLLNDVFYNRIDLGSGSENNLVNFYRIEDYNLIQIPQD
jgi:LysM repeat protein